MSGILGGLGSPEAHRCDGGNLEQSCRLNVAGVDVIKCRCYACSMVGHEQPASVVPSFLVLSWMLHMAALSCASHLGNVGVSEICA